MKSSPTLPLRPSGNIPLLGFGTWQLQGDRCRSALRTALEVGYRHIDTADGYENHASVASGIEDSGVARESLFLTTKVPREHLHRRPLVAACERYLKELKTDYIDLLLAHWPNSDIPVTETLEGMKELLDRKLIRAAGVSNWTKRRLADTLAAGIAPIAVNQVEYHPFLNQKELDQFCKEHDVVVTAYCPIAKGRVAENATIQEVARKNGRSAAQVTLRWLLQRQISAIPKSQSPERIRENSEVLDFDLSREDFDAIDNLGEWSRIITWEVAEFDDPPRGSK